MAYITDSFDEKAVSLLQQDGVGFMPSDTIYGLSCRALDKTAVEKLRQLKNRSAHKPFIILISDIKMLDLLSISRKEVAATEKYWPGSLTLICPAPNSPIWLHQGLSNLAIRIPDNNQLLQLINQTGPLISTSANIEDQQPATNLEEARKMFGEKLDFYVDKGVIYGRPSTIVKFVNGKLEVTRQGDIRI